MVKVLGSKKRIKQTTTELLEHLVRHIDSSERSYDFIGAFAGETIFGYLIGAKRGKDYTSKSYKPGNANKTIERLLQKKR